MSEKQKRTLFEIGDDIRALDSLLDEVGGDVTDEAASAYVEQLFSGNADALKNKIDGYCALCGELDALADVLEAEAKRLAAKAKSRRSKIDWLRGRMLDFMRCNEIKKVEAARYTVSVTAGQDRHRPVIFHESADAQAFLGANKDTPYVRHVEEWNWDTSEIRKALLSAECGSVIPNPKAPSHVTDLATLGPLKPGLIIR